MHPRTKRQKDVLEFITRFMIKHGYEPSYQQIALQIGVSSKGGIAKHIEALERQGFLRRRRENGSFGLELRKETEMAATAGRVALIESQLVDGKNRGFKRSDIVVPNFLLGSLLPEEVFAFKVPDNSMIDKQICEDDLVLLERRSYARRGEIVVVNADGEQMLIGRFFHAGTETELRPANPDYEPVTFPSDRIVVEGVMRGLLRPISPRED